MSDIDVDFLPIIHEIVKTIEKDPQVNSLSRIGYFLGSLSTLILLDH